jgi:HK97 gp10 family phage protein
MEVIMIELDTKGFQEMIDTLEKMDKEGEGIIKKALNEGIKPVINALKRRAPVLTGKLCDSINIGKIRKGKSGTYSQITGPRGEWYGRFSEFGTSKEPAHPWLRPAFDESQEEAYTKIETVMFEGIENAFKG